MKIEVDLNKRYLVFFGIIVAFALIGGVFAAVGHPASQIDWGSGVISIGSITSGQWMQLGNVVIQGKLLIANGTNGIGIGMGQNFPRYALDVNGSIQATGTICSGSICLTSGGTGGTSQWTTSGNDISYSGGNVGIGYATPGTKLDVAGNIGGQNITALGTLTGNKLCIKNECITNLSSITTTITTTTPGTPTGAGWGITYNLPIPDWNSSVQGVCTDDRMALAYEREGTIGRVYIAGAGPGGDIGRNCAVGTGTGYGFGQYASGKVLFATIDWNSIKIGSSVNVKAALISAPNGFNGNVGTDVAIFLTNMSATETTFGGANLYPAFGAQIVNYQLQLNWSSGSIYNYYYPIPAPFK